MSEIDLEAALRAARERCARAAVVDIRALADALDHLIALARVVGAAETSCYRTFNSGLGPFEADGDDERLSAYCHIPGYRMCESCRAKAEAEMFAHFEGE